VIDPKLADYRGKYTCATLNRSPQGVLEVTLHTNGSDLVWSFDVHHEMGYLFEDIGRDPDNKVIILTGTGSTFIANTDLPRPDSSPDFLVRLLYDAKRLIMSHLDIEVPMIAAINGPATVHAELALLCDIVLASDDVVFQDAPHFTSGRLPADGSHVVWQELLGPNRGRYFMLTGEKIAAPEAHRLGIVGEVRSRDELLPRARELALMILERPEMVVRYSRTALVQHYKQAMVDNLGYGLALSVIGGRSEGK
jgi:enoyl-CoA hydratase/carnithine racemase